MKRFAVIVLAFLLGSCQSNSELLPTLVDFPTATETSQASEIPIEASLSATETPTTNPTNSNQVSITVSPNQAPRGASRPPLSSIVLTNPTVTPSPTRATFTPRPTASFTPTITSSPTKTSTPRPTASFTPTATPTIQCYYGMNSQQRVNEPYTARAESIFGLSYPITVIDDSWETRVCGDEVTPLFQNCSILSIEVTSPTTQDERVSLVESLMSTQGTQLICENHNPAYLRIRFQASPQVYWKADYYSLTEAYTNGERGLTLYNRGTESPNP